MKTCIIIQARMGSTRLPGKVLRHILGKPMLERLLERIKKVNQAQQIIIATSNNKQDSPIEKLAVRLNTSCYRGSETNVLDRYFHAAKSHGADNIVRICGDNPAIDPRIVDQTITSFKNNKVDYASNTLVRSFPYGMDAEVFSMTALKKAWQNAISKYDHEHVTPYIYNPKNHFRVKKIMAPKMFYRPQLRLTVDELADLKLIRTIYRKLYRQNPNFDLIDILGLFDHYPNLYKVNQHVKQKKAKYHKL